MGSFNFFSSRMLWEMCQNEFKARYAGNFGGAVWAVVQPSVTIAIFWFVFSVGFRAAPVNETPFILWLMAGMIPWFFFAEGVSSSTNAVLESSFLIKKIVFEAALLPLVKIVSAFGVHLFFVFVMMGMYASYGYAPSLYWLQLLYYGAGMAVLVAGIGFLSSSVVVFFRDASQIVGMGVQFGFWLTPIFWSLEMVPQRYRWIFELNPMFYVTQGYRESMSGSVWFWEKPVESLVFWGVTLFMFGMGVVVFYRLRPHFADVM